MQLHVQMRFSRENIFLQIHFALWMLHENIYNCSSGNMAIQQTIATVHVCCIHAAVGSILVLCRTLAVGDRDMLRHA